MSPGVGLANPAVRYIGPSAHYVNPPEGVRCVQAAVGVPTDGQFGAVTYAAVRQFQAAHNLSPDGIVGLLTGDRIIVALPASARVYCAEFVPTTYLVMDDHGNLPGVGGTVYSQQPNGDPGAAVSMGKSAGACVVEGIRDEAIGKVGKLVKVIWQRRLPSLKDLGATDPYAIAAHMIYCELVETSAA